MYVKLLKEILEQFPNEAVVFIDIDPMHPDFVPIAEIVEMQPDTPEYPIIVSLRTYRNESDDAPGNHH